MNKQVVAVLFGGRSSEHSISSATAGGVLAAIDRDRFEVIPVGITRDGAFVLEEDRPEKLAMVAEAMPEVVDNGTRVIWPDAAGDRSMRVRRSDGTVDELGAIDVVLPILHGLHGEDGTIQGFLDIVGLPYAGCGVLDSALCMDKHFTKVVLEAAGIAVSPGFTVSAREWATDAEGVRERAATLELPLFVKPARAGSSVGVSKVHTPDELDEAVRVALAEDDKALIEQGVVGREIEVAVLAGMPGEPSRASLPGEIVLTRDFYDFEGKYLGGDGVDLVCPAALDEATTTILRSTAVRAFDALGCTGLARVDFFVTPDARVIINELNTLPGFTPISMFPQCWIATGMTYSELITYLIDNALARV